MAWWIVKGRRIWSNTRPPGGILIPAGTFPGDWSNAPPQNQAVVTVAAPVAIAPTAPAPTAVTVAPALPAGFPTDHPGLIVPIPATPTTPMIPGQLSGDRNDTLAAWKRLQSYAQSKNVNLTAYYSYSKLSFEARAVGLAKAEQVARRRIDQQRAGQAVYANPPAAPTSVVNASPVAVVAAGGRNVGQLAATPTQSILGGSVMTGAMGGGVKADSPVVQLSQGNPQTLLLLLLLLLLTLLKSKSSSGIIANQTAWQRAWAR